jgi:hypothetical protein
MEMMAGEYLHDIKKINLILGEVKLKAVPMHKIQIIGCCL